MAEIGEGSSALPKSMNEKPVIVRVKRKAVQSRLEAFWLEINERPLKRPLLDFEKLSISDSSGKEELKTKKVLVELVETVSSSKVTFDILRSVVPNSDEASKYKTKNEERRHSFKKENKQGQLLLRSRQKHEVLTKNARFEQIWRSRKGNKEAVHDKALRESCRLYDVERVDVEETSNEVHKPEDVSLEDHMILRNYLPLLKEFIPSAAEEIESDIHGYMYGQASKHEYVYDYYTVKGDMNTTSEDVLNPFPLVQVDDDDDDFYDGPAESEFESDDSNAEDNPRNDYPDEDEEISEEEKDSTAEDEETSEDEAGREDTADSVSEKSENASNNSPVPEDLGHHDLSEDADMSYEDEIYDGDDDDCDDGDGYGYDNDGGRW